MVNKILKSESPCSISTTKILIVLLLIVVILCVGRIGSRGEKMEKGDLILGRVSLNAYKIKNQVTPVIEILDSEGSSDGELVVLKVLRHK